MLTRLYWITWAISFAAAAVIFAAGYMTMLAVVAFGFLVFGLIFAGMMCVLPNVASHPTAPRPVEHAPMTEVTYADARRSSVGAVMKSA